MLLRNFCERPNRISLPSTMSEGRTIDRADLRDYLAAERTFLAWIRTGLALMGFGFVVARFGLFLQQIQIVQHQAAARSSGFSLWLGTALIAVGVIVNLFSAWHHARLIHELAQAQLPPSRPSTQAIGIAIFLALVGLAMAIYLVSVRRDEYSNFQHRQETSMASTAAKGIVNKPSHHSVDQTVEKLKGILQTKGVALFALVDHSGEAERVGMKMNPTKLLIFGNPKAGTPLMLAAPSIAIDLPLKILVWEDSQNKVWISYNSPEYLQERHGFPKELLKNIRVVEGLAAGAGE
jgi:uncharacterized protein (DUF302 family)/uncharacterized membrane protein YidH (DUF202 family)